MKAILLLFSLAAGLSLSVQADTSIPSGKQLRQAAEQATRMIDTEGVKKLIDEAPDLVLVDLDAPTVVDEQKLYSKCGWSPVSGYIFKSSIVATLVNGEMAFENGEVNPNIRGKRIAFNR